MRKIIAIGEMVLDTVFCDHQPKVAFQGGRVANTALELARMGFPVWMVSECCTDCVGDMLVENMASAGVNTECIDRFTDGATAFSAIFHQPDKVHRINYFDYRETDSRFNVVWPRIDADDVVIIGSLYCVEQPQRTRLFQLVKHAAEMGAVIINLPGFQHGVNTMIAKLMPALIENMEVSSLVIAKDEDATQLYPDDPADRMYADHVAFYGPSMMQIADDFTSVTVHAGKDCHKVDTGRSHTDPVPDTLTWQAAFTAGVVSEILRRDLTHDQLLRLPLDTMRDIAARAIDTAAKLAKPAWNI